jgi:hypothetical protein
MPVRIQRKRTKGWKLPPNTVCVTRPGKWGNPFRVGCHYRRGNGGDSRFTGMGYVHAFAWEPGYTTIKTPDEAVEWYRWYYTAPAMAGVRDRMRRELRGKNLACFCAPGSPCHADILLEIANAL